jgi:hypothetical protein
LIVEIPKRLRSFINLRFLWHHNAIMTWPKSDHWLVWVGWNGIVVITSELYNWAER